MTTPEQLQKWRKDFELQVLLSIDMSIDVMGKYYWNGLEKQWQIYLRRSQEAEQAIKDAGKQALKEAAAVCNSVCDPYNTEHGNGYNRAALDCAKKIKELLND